MSYSPTNVFKGTAVFTAGRILTKATAFFLIPVYTRFLTPADYGIVGYVQTVTQFLAVLLLFGFHGAQKRYFYEKSSAEHEIGSFLFSINLYLIGVLLFFCTAVSVFGENLYYTILTDARVPFSPYFKIFIWAIGFQVMNQVVIDFYLARRQHKQCALLQVANFFLITGGILYYVVVIKQGALGQIKGVLLGNALFFAFFYPRYAKNFRVNFSLEKLRYALAFGVPIVFHLLAGILHTSIDRVILERFVSIKELGIYTLGYQMGTVMNVVVRSASQSWTPEYYELMNQGDIDRAYELRRTFSVWVSGICILSLIGALWSKEILFVLTPPAFHEAARILPVILFAYIFQGIYFFVSKPIFFFKRTIILPFTTGTSALINIALNLLLIPKWGVLGAAYATAISFTFMAVIVYLASRRLFDPVYELGRVALVIVAFFIACVVLRFDEITFKVELMKFGVFFSFVGVTYICFGRYFKSLACRMAELVLRK